MPVQCPEQAATLEEFGSPCVCGAENFERVVVERVLSRPVVNDLIACVECHGVYYSPLPRPALLPPPSNAPPAGRRGHERAGVGADMGVASHRDTL